jgi:hypothetical protein
VGTSLGGYAVNRTYANTFWIADHAIVIFSEDVSRYCLLNTELCGSLADFGIDSVALGYLPVEALSMLAETISPEQAARLAGLRCDAL